MVLGALARAPHIGHRCEPSARVVLLSVRFAMVIQDWAKTEIGDAVTLVAGVVCHMKGFALLDSNPVSVHFFRFFPHIWDGLID